MRVISIFPFGIAVFFIQVSTSTPNQVRFHHSSSTSSIYVFFPALSLVFFIFILVKKFHHRLQCIVAQFPIEFIWFYHFRENRKHSSREWISLFFSPHPRSHFFALSFFDYGRTNHFIGAFICMVDIFMPTASLLYQLNHAGKLLVKCRLNER